MIRYDSTVIFFMLSYNTVAVLLRLSPMSYDDELPIFESGQNMGVVVRHSETLNRNHEL